jgi:hypothetical protein
MKAHTRRAHTRRLSNGRRIRVRGSWVSGATVNRWPARLTMKTDHNQTAATTAAPQRIAAPAPILTPELATSTRRGFGAVGVLLVTLAATLLLTAPG